MVSWPLFAIAHGDSSARRIGSAADSGCRIRLPPRAQRNPRPKIAGPRMKRQLSMPLLHSPCARLCNRPTAIILVIAVAVCFGSLRPAGGALTPDSPQVQRLIEKGMAYLDNVQDRRLGGICLIGLCQFKHTGDPQQRQVVAAENRRRCWVPRESQPRHDG